MDFSELLEPYNGPQTVIRKSTDASLFAEKLVCSFLESGMESARVSSDKTPFDAARLHAALYNVSVKKAYIGKVSVSKKGRHIVLRRKR